MLQEIAFLLNGNLAVIILRMKGNFDANMTQIDSLTTLLSEIVLLSKNPKDAEHRKKAIHRIQHRA
jgi:hypothetical protein